MSKVLSQVWKLTTTQELVKVLVAIDDPNIMRKFLRDVMTEKEITEISARLKAAYLLQNGSTYSEIVAKTRLSSRTIARISDWMQNGCEGYKEALGILSMSHHSHTSPASAD